eukprot:351007-Ditylum_brightwellii.AAC.1
MGIIEKQPAKWQLLINGKGERDTVCTQVYISWIEGRILANNQVKKSTRRTLANNQVKKDNCWLNANEEGNCMVPILGIEGRSDESLSKEGIHRIHIMD